jgi:ribosomal protein S18 acetylase RimI-like enzyme
LIPGEGAIALLVVDAMTIHDYPEVLALWMRIPELGVAPGFDNEDRIAAYLGRNPRLSTVARRDDAIVGTALCGHDGRRGSIYHLAVAPEHRHQGIATHMMARCIEQLQQNGIHSAFLFSGHDTARQFWMSQGWPALPSITYHHKEF